MIAFLITNLFNSRLLEPDESEFSSITETTVDLELTRCIGSWASTKLSVPGICEYDVFLSINSLISSEFE